ncbi:hypothetical protein [Agrococcus sp. ARC_14]|uniref:hypothetical protein n=1 Tax=Agrococcus sp. ARC_14 TaxID=2919927 RepID=UPI001F05A001|nr:hypothetical protein [Agrococcus sp. ARC_14]MCH1882352.1 hypothetical protein [Agrococcus sp. ARC_14]
MRELRLRGRPPLLYVFLGLTTAAMALLMIGTPVWLLALPLGALAVVCGLLAVRAGTTRFALEPSPEPTLELGSAFGRARVPLAAIALVRRRLVLASRGSSYEVWEVLGHDGARLAKAADLGLSVAGTRELETELRLARVPLDPA